MSEALLTLLRWCLLALIYLFFFRVLQATWLSTAASARGGVSKAAGRAAAAGSKTKRRGRQKAAATQSLVVVQPPEIAGASYPLVGALSIGRAAGCEITLDDTFVSQVHARVALSDSGVVVEDLGSTNGTYLNRKRVTAPVVVMTGDLIQVGSTVMELQ